MAPGRGMVLLIMLVAVVALAAGETALSKGMKQIDRLQGGWMAQAVGLVGNGWVAAGLVLLVAHLGLYMLALKSADLSYVLPLTAASYPLAALLARFYLHEEIGFSRIAGTLLITVGVAIVVLGEGGAGRTKDGGRRAEGIVVPGGASSGPAQASPSPVSPAPPSLRGPLETG
jgi:drug/metabolite transporter (DMT)-like permease